MIGPPAELAQQLVGLCEVFSQVLATEVQTLSDRLIAQLADVPGFEELYAQADTPGQPPSSG